MSGLLFLVQEEGKELSADEMGRKIASQWTTDPEAAGSAQSAAPTSDATSQVMMNLCLSRDTHTACMLTSVLVPLQLHCFNHTHGKYQLTPMHSSANRSAVHSPNCLTV